MIIYGSRASHLKSAQSNMAVCPNCGTKGALVFSIFGKYAHIFWIPLFPFGKKGVSQCQHCKHTMEVKEMPADVKEEYDNFKVEAKTPIWHFTGLVLIAVLAVVGVYTSKQDKKKELAYIAAPAAGDVYEVTAGEGFYTTMKVDHVTKDSVFVRANDYETNKRSKTYQLDEEENYSEFTYGIPRNKLEQMYASGKIFDVSR